MSKRLIKPYSQWINEAAAPDQPGAAQAVTFISASSSASNVTPALSAKMGVEPNKLYTFNLKSIGQIQKIYLDGKFGGDQAKAAGIILDPATAVATKPGEDILEINGKRITEQGSIVFTKAELYGKPAVIKASGNGLLTLLRMGEGLVTMYTTHKNSIYESKDWSMRFAIGGNVTEKDARGFSYWFAKPGQLEADSNLLAMIVALATLKAAGYDDRIAKTDVVVAGWYKNMIEGKDPKTSITEVANHAARALAKRMMLTQDPPANVTTAWTVTDYKPLLKVPNEVAKIRITDAGTKALAPIVTAIATAVAPIAPPPGFGAESQGVLTAYAEMIKSGLAAKANQVGYWLETSQTVSNWGKTTQTPGMGGTATAQQKEGEFGPKKP